MTVEYTATPDDVSAMYQQSTIKHVLWIVAGSFAALSLGINVIASRALYSRHLLEPFVWACGVLVIIPRLGQLLADKTKRLVIVTPESLCIINGKLKATLPWKKVKTVSTTHEYIFIMFGFSGFPVPRRAFQNVEERNQFVGLCQSYLKDSFPAS